MTPRLEAHHRDSEMLEIRCESSSQFLLQPEDERHGKIERHFPVGEIVIQNRKR
jgi:hypothetical protein